MFHCSLWHHNLLARHQPRRYDGNWFEVNTIPNVDPSFIISILNCNIVSKNWGRMSPRRFLLCLSNGWFWNVKDHLDIQIIHLVVSFQIIRQGQGQYGVANFFTFSSCYQVACGNVTGVCFSTKSVHQACSEARMRTKLNGAKLILMSLQSLCNFTFLHRLKCVCRPLACKD